MLASVADLPDRSGEQDQRPATVSILVEGWPDDLRTCVEALVEHLPPGVVVQASTSATSTVRATSCTSWRRPIPRLSRSCTSSARPAGRRPAPRCSSTTSPGSTSGSTPRRCSRATPCGRSSRRSTTRRSSAPGWRGVDVDRADDWRSFVDAGAGEVDAILGYLFAVRRSAALAVGGPHPKARFYRNADMEFSLMLRAAGGRLVVPAGDLPVRQDRHRGYHDSDPAYRDAESAKTYSGCCSGSAAGRNPRAASCLTESE